MIEVYAEGFYTSGTVLLDADGGTQALAVEPRRTSDKVPAMITQS
jgi:hypothetical protein